METSRLDGKPFNPKPICNQKNCPTRSSVRLQEHEEYGGDRRDLCIGHARQALRVYEDKVDVIAVWNGYTLEDVENER